MSNNTTLNTISLLDDDLLQTNCGGLYTIPSGISTGVSTGTLTTGLNNINWGDLSVNTTLDGKALTVRGDASIDGQLFVEGVNIGESLRRIEERLNILRPHQRLEGEWEELRELGKRYRELEAKLLDGEKILEILGGGLDK